MLRPLVLTGAPAVGKSTSGRRLAEERSRAAFIDVDDVRQLVVAGAETLWGGPDGSGQFALAARNASAMARNFGAAGFEVVVADFVTPDSLAVYRDDLPDCFVVHLGASLAEARRRAATRTVYLTDGEFELLHRMVAVPPSVDLVLEVDGLTEDGQLSRLRSEWRSASGTS